MPIKTRWISYPRDLALRSRLTLPRLDRVVSMAKLTPSLMYAAVRLRTVFAAAMAAADGFNGFKTDGDRIGIQEPLAAFEIDRPRQRRLPGTVGA